MTQEEQLAELEDGVQQLRQELAEAEDAYNQRLQDASYRSGSVERTRMLEDKAWIHFQQTLERFFDAVVARDAFRDELIQRDLHYRADSAA